ncbi:Card1-like endonuclease domain-containing protein [Neisseria sp. S1]|uniref:Card1-like endonuclease domain-containing protein n=1 Tax=Neisseria sp. S1 TaxID=3318354 RepID=UPI003A84BE1E
MKKFDVHVCLVSDQAVPNFVPVLDKDFRPGKVLLLVTEKMQAKADALAGALKKRCPEVQVEKIALPSEYDMAGVEERLLELLCDVENDQIALNVTGGTKLMAIAAYGMFKEVGRSAFYFTADSNEVLLLGAGDKERFTLQPPKMKIEDYLALHGYPAKAPLQKQVSHKTWLPFAQDLVRHTILAEGLPALNYAISKAIKEKKEYVTVCDIPKSEEREQLLDLLEKHGLAEVDDGKLCFPDEDALRYVAGGWFEDYVFDIAKSLPGVQDIAINVQIVNAKAGIEAHNELDVVLLANNVLHVIECKTANFAKREEKAEDALYKLESLKKLGGLRTRAMFVSYHGLPSHSRDRALSSQIDVIEKSNLTGMKTIMEKWIYG